MLLLPFFCLMSLRSRLLIESEYAVFELVCPGDLVPVLPLLEIKMAGAWIDVTIDEHSVCNLL